MFDLLVYDKDNVNFLDFKYKKYTSRRVGSILFCVFVKTQENKKNNRDIHQKC